MATEAIQTRYAKELKSEHCGCANLWPFLEIKSGISILDLGSGNGAQTYALAAKTGTGQTVGLDLTEEMVAFASQNFRLSNLQFIVGDIAAIPLPDNSIDLVTSNCVINHAADKARVYGEIFRVLKSGGKFVIGDVCALDTISETEASDPAKIAECWAGALPREVYLEKIGQSGLKNLEILSSREYTKANHRLESIIIRGVKQ